LIFDAADRLLMLRRASDVALFAGCWDVVGGHLEPGEDPAAALRREVHEETGWRVRGIIDRLGPWTWQGDDGRTRTEYDYLITVDGDLAAPRLDPAEHAGFRWLAESELGLLDDDPSQIRLVADAGFAALHGGYAARVAPVLDTAFRSAMAEVAERGGRDLVQSFGGEPAGMLITFRTALAQPGRRVSRAQADTVWRYLDRAACWATMERSAAAGFVELTDAGFRAAPRGAQFLAALYAHQEQVTAQRWAGLDATVALATELLGRLLAAAADTGGEAFHTMAPPYEAGAGPGAVLLNRMGTFRYHRADAHAAAWQAAGLTAAQIVAMEPGPERDAIEAETNRLAASPFAALTGPERAALVEDLSTLAVSS